MGRFYLDENIPVGVAPLLAAAFHETVTTRSAGNLGTWDADQLSFATEQGLTLVTHDRRDYRTLHDAWIRWSPHWQEPRPHAGILILDKGQRLAAPDYTEAIVAFLSTAPPSLTNLAFDWFARDSGVWVQWRP